jgi:lycopene beta-cyclase
MDEKPVIIIGGGLWGTLLALRIRECLPQVPLKLYEKGPQLGEKLAVSFHESDVSPESMKWLRPFISRQWDEFQVSFPRYTRTNSHRLCTMEPAHFHAVAREKLGANTVYLNKEVSPEEAMKEGSFVIDTISRGYYKALGYQKTHGLVVKLLHPHRRPVPLTMDATVPQRSGFRYLQTLPINEETILVKDVRFSSDPQIYHEDFEMELLRELHQRRWVVGDILERETEFRKIPREKEENFCEGRVIRLDGFVHDITGDALPDAVRLIDRMVKTSFRLGELKSVMKQYLEDRRSQRKILRMMNSMLYRAKTPCKQRYQFFESLHSMPPSVREKFYKGDLEFFDVIRTLMNVSLIPRRNITELTLNKNPETVAIV